VSAKPNPDQHVEAADADLAGDSHRAGPECLLQHAVGQAAADAVESRSLAQARPAEAVPVVHPSHLQPGHQPTLLLVPMRRAPGISTEKRCAWVVKASCTVPCSAVGAALSTAPPTRKPAPRMELVKAAPLVLPRRAPPRPRSLNFSMIVTE